MGIGQRERCHEGAQGPQAARRTRVVVHDAWIRAAIALGHRPSAQCAVRNEVSPRHVQRATRLPRANHVRTVLRRKDERGRYGHAVADASPEDGQALRRHEVQQRSRKLSLGLVEKRRVESWRYAPQPAELVVKSPRVVVVEHAGWAITEPPVSTIQALHALVVLRRTSAVTALAKRSEHFVHEHHEQVPVVVVHALPADRSKPCRQTLPFGGSQLVPDLFAR